MQLKAIDKSLKQDSNLDRSHHTRSSRSKSFKSPEITAPIPKTPRKQTFQSDIDANI